MIAIINREWKKKKKRINYVNEKEGNMAKVCSLNLVENSKGEQGTVSVFVGDKEVGYLERGGDLVFSYEGTVEMSSLDLFLLSRRSNELRTLEIKRLQALLDELTKKGRNND
jgi:hypothetical protein